MPWTKNPAIKNEFLSAGLDAVQAGQQVILKYFNTDLKIEHKADESLVTRADKEAEEKIKQVINHHFPDHGFLGEESGSSAKASKYTWVIDPIDGTKNYVRGLPFFSTLLALVKDGEVVMGISNMPQFNELVYAVKNEGSYLNHQKIQVSTVDDISSSYLSIGTFAKFREKGFDQNVIKLASTVRHQRAWGDCWHFHLLALGKIDIVIEAHGDFWDFAPMKVFIQEAGGKVTDIYGQPFDMNSKSIIASNGLLHDQVVRIINDKNN